MPNIDTLNNVIAVVVVILTLSMVVQSIQALFKKLVAIKSQQLEDSLVDLFEHVLGNQDVRAGMLRNSPVLRRFFRQGALTEKASGQTQVVVKAVLGQFQRLGRVTQGGTFMLDSLSRADLLKVLARVAPDTLLANVTTNVQTVCTRIKSIEDQLEAINKAGVPAEASAIFARVHDALAPLLNDYRTLTSGGTVKPTVVLGDLYTFGQQAASLPFAVLAELQTKIAATQTNPPNPATTNLLALLQTLTTDLTTLRTTVEKELAPLKKLLVEINTWFDTVMQGFEERYTRGMKTWSFVISAIVVICLNANLFNVYNAIAGGDLLRGDLQSVGEQLVAKHQQISDAEKLLAEKQAAPPSTTAASATATLQADIEKNRREINDLVQLYAGFGFKPLGIAGVCNWAKGLPPGNDWSSWRARRADDFHTLLGWFIMTLLLSLGAPFWEDTLESLFGIKNLLRKRTDTQNVEDASGAGNPKP